MLQIRSLRVGCERHNIRFVRGLLYEKPDGIWAVGHLYQSNPALMPRSSRDATEKPTKFWPAKRTRAVLKRERVSGSKIPKHSRQKISATDCAVSIDEVYALEELFDSLSNSLHRDGLIHKDEFAYALFKTQGRNSIFVDKVFQGFDTKHNDTIDFEEFVQALSIFHPKAGLEEKANFAFAIYDLENTNYIEPHEVQRFLAALLKENPSIRLEDSQINNIVSQTFREADLAGDGHISREEWLALVRSNPGIISCMTLPVLKEVTTKYPSFLFNKNRP